MFSKSYLAIFWGRKFALTNSFCPLFCYRVTVERSSDSLLFASVLFVCLPFEISWETWGLFKKSFYYYFFGILAPFLVLSCLKRLGQFHPPLPFFYPSSLTSLTFQVLNSRRNSLTWIPFPLSLRYRRELVIVSVLSMKIILVSSRLKR